MRIAVKYYKSGGINIPAYPWPYSHQKHNENDSHYAFSLYEGSDFVGYANLLKTPYGFWETHVSIMNEYQNQGYGKKLYEYIFKYAKKKNIKVRSSRITTQRSEARFLWFSKDLRRKFKIRRKGNRYCVE